MPGDPSDFDLDSDELVSHAAAVDFALGTITEIADHAPSDGRRLSALNVLGRILGPEHIRNRLMRLANTTKSDATRLSAVYVLSRGLGIVGPIAPRNPEEPRIEMINVWPASEHELEEIRQRDAQIELRKARPPAERPTAARRNPHPTPRDPLPRLPTPTIPRFKHPSPIDRNPRSQHANAQPARTRPIPRSPHQPTPALPTPTPPPHRRTPQHHHRRPRHHRQRTSLTSHLSPLGGRCHEVTEGGFGRCMTSGPSPTVAARQLSPVEHIECSTESGSLHP